ncbi:Sec23-binding domain of Sec16-domain-containing protein [Phycomyces nitens]|nr:Sec23-binding domain of Sec16-domain-containing protein [Phycomyces nitens]
MIYLSHDMNYVFFIIILTLAFIQNQQLKKKLARCQILPTQKADSRMTSHSSNDTFVHSQASFTCKMSSRAPMYSPLSYLYDKNQSKIEPLDHNSHQTDNDLYAPSQSLGSHNINIPEYPKHQRYLDPNTIYQTRPAEKISLPVSTLDASQIRCPDPRCGGENELNSKFCIECGASIICLVRHKNSVSLRSRGFPLVSFGFGGKLLIVFPRTRHNAASLMPFRLYNLNDLLHTCQDVKSLADFVGPLWRFEKGKPRHQKRALLAYIEQRIKPENPTGDSRMLLWKCVYELVAMNRMPEHKDEPGHSILKALRRPIDFNDQCTFQLPIEALLEPAQQIVEDEIRILNHLEELLALGDRQAAVLYCIQEDLWSHALVISSCVSKSVWQQTILEFTCRELKGFKQQKRDHLTVSDNRPALRVLYSLFSGKGELAISEFLQTLPCRTNAPYGSTFSDTLADPNELTYWRDTLILILANRTHKDDAAILALGDVMKTHNWIDEALICYLASPTSLINTDAGMAQWSLLIESTFEPIDLDILYLTEILESIYNPLSVIPTIQAYKIWHAWQLSDLGYIDMAQSYVDDILQIIKADSEPCTAYLELLRQARVLGLHCAEARSRKIRSEKAVWFKARIPHITLDTLWCSVENTITRLVGGDEV